MTVLSDLVSCELCGFFNLFQGPHLVVFCPYRSHQKEILIAINGIDLVSFRRAIFQAI